MSHMYAGYNKNNAKGTLIGNWVEEDALRNATGFSRRKIPAPMFTPDYKETRFEPTQERVLMHIDRSAANGLETTYQSCAKQVVEGSSVIKSIQANAIGPRSHLRDAELLEHAKRLQQHEKELKQQKDQLEHSTTTSVSHATFQSFDSSVLTSITRLPRGKNASRVVDPSIQHLTKGEVDSIDQIKLQVLHHHNTVTRYSHAITMGVGLDFPTTVSDGLNAFGRSSAFTNEITDPTKRHGEAMEPGSDVDERLGMSIHQRAALRKLGRLTAEAPTTMQMVLERLDPGNQGDPLIELSVFRQAFAAIQHLLKEKEVIHIFMYFDTEAIGMIPYQSFREYVQQPTIN